MPRDLIDELLEGRVKATLFGGDRAPRLGRLVILEPVGAGAMGTVFAAYDPRLDRKVAVKLVRGGAADATARLLAEARALGKLAHPNVVAVHDADLEGDAVYVVMELAPGPSLREWIATAPPRPWRDVVAAMAQVARGLAAAHRAGLVHRDVKPDNVRIGPDRARLVDFGLAAALDAGGDRVAGTPRYMAPEVLAGGAATAAADQFAFGVTLYEALHGRRPHDGATRDELAAAATAAATARPADGAPRVPAWLAAVASRALAADPAARFPTMDELAAELTRDRRRRRRTAIAAAVVLAALAVTGLVAYRGGAGAAARDPCAGGTRAAAALPELDARLAGALGDAPWAGRAAAGLHDFAAAWGATFRRVCEATRVRGAQPDSLYALRMRCLDRRLERAVALVAALVDAGRLPPDAAAGAAAQIAALPGPAACEALVDPGELALPDAPDARRRAIAAEHALDRAWATYALGRYPAARDQLAPVLAAADADAAPAVAAGALLLAASIEGRIGAPAAARAQLVDALAAAARAQAADLEAAAWVRLLREELFAGEPAKVAEYAPFARAAAVRAGLDGAELDGVLGEALRHTGDLAAARAALSRGLASRDPLRGEQRAVLEMNLGAVELAAGHPALADAALSRALALAEAALGPEHPELAIYVEKQAAAAVARGALATALADHDRVLALRRAAFGDTDRAVATARLRRAETLVEAGRLAEAEADLAAARAIRADVHGAGHVRLGEVERVAGLAAEAAGRRDVARAAYRRAAELDPRLDVDGALVRLGAPLEGVGAPVVPPLGDGEALTPARAEALAARIARLPPAAARAEVATVVAAWRRDREALAPAIAVAVGTAARAAGDRAAAAEAFAAALAALAREPGRTRLAAARGLADAGDEGSSRAAAAEARELAAALPELAVEPAR